MPPLVLAMNEDIRTSVQFCFDHKDMADSSFFIGNDPENTTALFKFQKMLAQHWGDEIVATTSQNIPICVIVSRNWSVEEPTTNRPERANIATPSRSRREICSDMNSQSTTAG